MNNVNARLRTSPLQRHLLRRKVGLWLRTNPTSVPRFLEIAVADDEVAQELPITVAETERGEEFPE